MSGDFQGERFLKCKRITDDSKGSGVIEHAPCCPASRLFELDELGVLTDTLSTVSRAIHDRRAVEAPIAKLPRSTRLSDLLES